MDLPAKDRLKAELVARLEEQISTLERAHDATVQAATHEEAKPENDKDTRALEQSYLARGQALRTVELRASLVDVRAMPLRAFGAGDPIALGAVVIFEEEESEKSVAVFLAPHGGGIALGGGAVSVVTPRSAMGRALLGARRGDDCEAKVGNRTRSLHIVDVH